MATDDRDHETLAKAWAFVASPKNWRDAAKEHPILIPFGERGPQAGYVGSKYAPGGLLVMGQNPRAGHSKRGFREGDDELYRLQSALIKEPTVERFSELMRFQKEFMRGWDIFKAIGFPESFGLGWDDISYVNSLACPTKDDAAKPKVWKACAKGFLMRQVGLLRPGGVMSIGALARGVQAEFLDGVRSCWMPHPTGQYAKGNPGVLAGQLAECRAFCASFATGLVAPPAPPPSSEPAPSPKSSASRAEPHPGETVLDVLSAAFPGMMVEKEADYTFRFGPGATIYVRKGAPDIARIRKGAVDRFPAGEKLAAVMKRLGVRIDQKSEKHPDYLIGPKHVIAVVEALRGE